MRQAGIAADNSARYAQEAAALQAKGQQNQQTALRVGGAAISGGMSIAAEAAAKKAAEKKAEDDAANTTSDKRAKKNITKVQGSDLDQFLKSLTKNKYQYKDENDGKGEHVGPMAQDLAKSKIGRITLSTSSEGKMQFNKDKMQGVILAAIKHLSDKIDGKG
jgi:hypothetical protein